MIQILNHIGRCHRNDPNFHCVCGINGCVRMFKKYYTWRKHIQNKDTNIGNDNLPSQFDDQPQFGEMDIDPGENDLGESQDQMKRSSALYLLKLKLYLLKLKVLWLIQRVSCKKPCPF
jgi:hypothetical protein